MARGSTLLLEEYFESADPRFLNELYASDAEKMLKALGERWVKDARSPMREMLLAYIDDGCDRSHHRPLIKKLFKCAEDAGDDELLGHFMVAFDRLTRRRLSSGPHGPRLVSDRVSDANRFSAATRVYVARRAFRYFRTLGHKDPARYGRAIRAALALYQDEHLATVEQLLDAWGLMHALYWGSPVLDRHPRGIVVRPGRAISELRPTPIYPDCWAGVFPELLSLARRARSRTVRSFSIQI